MPNYEFACKDCGHSFNKILKVDDRNKTQTCPECGSENAERSYGSFMVPNYRKLHFKGQAREAGKNPKTVHLGYKTKPTRWGFSKH